MSGNSKMISLRGYILAKMGRTTDAEQVLNTLNGIAGDRYVPPYAMALVHAGLGQTDQAFQWLDKATNERDVHLVLARRRIPSGTPIARTHDSGRSSNAVTSCAPLPPPEPHERATA